MPVDNYANLVASIASWLQDSDVNAVIPDWITLLESDVNKRLRAMQSETNDTLTVSSELTALPSGWRSFRKLRHASSPYEELELVSEMWAGEHFNWIATGRPRKYLIEANQLRTVPAPDTSYILNITYWEAVPALTSTNTTNWLLTAYPEIYLFGTLAKSKGYLGDDSRISTWEMEYEKGLDSLIKADNRARYSGSTPAMRVRVAP